MKKPLLLVPIAGILAYLSLSSNSGGIFGQSTSGCNANSTCHGASPGGTTLSISGIPAGGWVSGTAYTLTATVTNATKAAAGFDLSVPAINGGTISNPGAGAQIFNSTEIGHSSPKSMAGGSASWTFTWTAPTSAAATAVTFNMAGNAVNLSSTSAGDAWAVSSGPSFTFPKATTTTPPAAPTVTASGPTTICSGGTFPTLTASSSGATAYTWSNGTTQVGTGATFTPTAAGTYTATATNTAGTSSASAPTTITVNPSPVLTAVQSDATLCPGQCDTITLTSSVANTSYAFTVAGGGSGTGTGNRIVFCFPPLSSPTTPQVMTITGTVAGTNCQGTTTQTITPNPVPTATFTQTALGLTYNFTGPTGTGLTYAWNFGNGQTSTLQNPSVTYATAGSYTVTLTVTNSTGCSATSTQTLIATTSVAGLVGVQGFRFGPNPARRELTIHTGALRADVRLLDLSGKTVATLRTRSELSAEKTVSLAHLSAGLYFLEVTTKDARGMEKLLVQ